jgi:hypothetical protein
MKATTTGSNRGVIGSREGHTQIEVKVPGANGRKATTTTTTMSDIGRGGGGKKKKKKKKRNATTKEATALHDGAEEIHPQMTRRRPHTAHLEPTLLRG